MMVMVPRQYFQLSNCVGPAAWVLPRGSCRVGPAAWVLPRGSCRVGPAAWVLPRGSCRVGPAAWVLLRLSGHNCHCHMQGSASDRLP